jgi:hypothetical protein
MSPHLRAAHHLTLCPQCAAEVDAQRQARAALRDSRPIDVPTSLLGQLSQIPHHNPVMPPEAEVDRTQFADGTERARRKRR